VICWYLFSGGGYFFFFKINLSIYSLVELVSVFISILSSSLVNIVYIFNVMFRYFMRSNDLELSQQTGLV